jgi:DNA polymerase delta subunit 2
MASVYTDIDQTTARFEDWLLSFVDCIDVDVMPGAQDFSNAYLPQQPINSFLLPRVGMKTNLNLVTNPHRFSVCDGLQFLGTSGQNVHDVRLYSSLDDSPLSVMRSLMAMQHLCPTAPDTLRSFPFRTEDPFVVDRAPHVFFVGCQPTYAEEVIYQHKSEESLLKLISVPTFARSRSIVLLDTKSLQSYELKFGQPLSLKN